MAVSASRGGWLWLRVLVLGGWDMEPFLFLSRSSVVRLLVAGRPSAIIGGIALVVVNAVNSQIVPVSVR